MLKKFLGKKRDIPLKADKKDKKKLPILVNDDSWKSIMKKNSNRKIKSLELELNNLIEGKKSLEKEKNTLLKEKDKILKKILYLSDMINNDNSKEQEKIEKEITSIKEELVRKNERIDNINLDLSEMPPLIEDTNYNLLKETVNEAYNNYINDQNKLNKVENKISEKRLELDKLRLEKDDLESNLEETYSMLHTIVGHENIEKIDKHFEDGDKDD